MSARNHPGLEVRSAQKPSLPPLPFTCPCCGARRSETWNPIHTETLRSCRWRRSKFKLARCIVCNHYDDEPIFRQKPRMLTYRAWRAEMLQARER